MIFVYKHPPLSTKNAHVYDLEGALSTGYTHPHYQTMPSIMNLPLCTSTQLGRQKLQPRKCLPEIGINPLLMDSQL